MGYYDEHENEFFTYVTVDLGVCDYGDTLDHAVSLLEAFEDVDFGLGYLVMPGPIFGCPDDHYGFNVSVALNTEDEAEADARGERTRELISSGLPEASIMNAVTLRARDREQVFAPLKERANAYDGRPR